MRLTANRLFFTACLLAAIVHLAWAARQLPEQMASHFGGSGQADGWSSRGEFVIVYTALLLGIGALFAVLAAFLPRLPRWMFSIPNPQYWMTPERESATRRWVADRLLQIGGATLLFQMVTLQMTVGANAVADPKLSAWFWLAFVAYMVYVMYWTVKLLLDTRLPRE